MEPHWRIALLFVGCMAYLFFGAVVFSTIEGNNEETTRKTLNDSISTFLDEHPSVSFKQLMKLLECIKEASDQGITPDVMLTKTNTSAEWVRIEKPGRRNWDLANAFFFSATVVTTIGYGHLAPSTDLGRNICLLYAFIGIPFIGWLLAEVTIFCRKRGRRIGEKIYTKLGCFLTGAKLRRVLTGAIMFTIMYSIIILLPATSFSFIEDWNFHTAHYFCFITLSTIGFGDYVATDNFEGSNIWRWLYKVATVLYFMVGLASLAVVLNSVQQRQQMNVKKIRAAFGRKVYHINNENGELHETQDSGTWRVVAKEEGDDDEGEEEKVEIDEENLEEEEGTLSTDESNDRPVKRRVIRESVV